MTENRTDAVRLEVKAGAAHVTIDRPPLNVLDIPTNRALASTLRSLRARDDVKVVVLAGAGTRAFSAGVEVRDHTPERIEDMLDAFHDVFAALANLNRLTVAAVRGLALGGGCELVAFCDVTIAEESAVFGLPEIKLGCFPPVAAVLLPHLVGRKHAAELILSGEPIGAKEAFEIGLVTKLVPDGALERELPGYLARFTEKSAAVLQLTYETLRADWPLDFFEALKQVERVYVDQLMESVDAREGIEAWIEKRAPQWKNR
ncbi:MAG: enoyl-CoA hydratase/isomerase family protein [Candidatus Eiseniibacteriota bacterium]